LGESSRLRDVKFLDGRGLALLDRGWGRPLQVVAGDEQRPIAISFEWAPATLQSQDDAPTIEG
jgi:hypothetical protein